VKWSWRLSLRNVVNSVVFWRCGLVDFMMDLMPGIRVVLIALGRITPMKREEGNDWMMNWNGRWMGLKCVMMILVWVGDSVSDFSLGGILCISSYHR